VGNDDNNVSPAKQHRTSSTVSASVEVYSDDWNVDMEQGLQYQRDVKDAEDAAAAAAAALPVAAPLLRQGQLVGL
jgi:cell division septal protein FtsQ